MKKILFILFVLVVPFITKAQEDTQNNMQEGKVEYRVGDLFFGINAGLDYNQNAFRTSADAEGFEFYGISPHYNFGVDFGVMATQKFRPRLEVKYVKMSYGQYWPEEFSTFKNTVTKTDNMDLNLHLDYLLLNSRKLKIFISPALKSEFALSARYKTFKTDGDDSDSKYSDLSEYYPRNVLGGAVSSIFKYDLGENIGITFTPEYTVFGRGYQRSNSELYQRFSANIGIELRFH